MRKILMALLMAGLTAVAAAETVYKWVDGAGQVHYTDLPPRQSDAKVLGIYHQSSGVDEEGAEGDDYTEESGDGGDGGDTTAPATTRPTPEPPVSREAYTAAQQDAEKAKVEQCKKAQDRYQLYLDSRRLYRETNGKREYLTDQELTEARARARQSVSDYCS